MARTPFYARITSPTAGNTSYTVPAGKVAVFEMYWVPTTSSGETSTDVLTAIPTIAINGVNTFAVDMWKMPRLGPFVLDAGDTISTPGGGTALIAQRIGIVGFLFNQSTKKSPLKTKMTTTTSYTVPVGNYVVVNFFHLTDGCSGSVRIDGNIVGNIGLGGIFADPAPQTHSGPYTAASGQVITLRSTPPGIFPQIHDGSEAVFMNGFIYNNG